MPVITKEEIKALCKVVNEVVEDINWGGCGVFAYLVGTTLSKFDNCSVGVRVINRMGDNSKELKAVMPVVKDDVDNWHENGVYFSHIILEVTLNNTETFLMDSDTEFEEGFYGLMKGSIELSDIFGIISKPRGWNDMFDRKQIPKIPKVICSFIKGVNKSVKGLRRDLSLKDWQLTY